VYKYETHLHTSPVSRCARATAEETVNFYVSQGYDGIFITNHYPTRGFSCAVDASYEDVINYLFSDYEKALKAGEGKDIKIFFGVEITLDGTDFLIYGPNKEFYLQNPQLESMPMRKRLEFLISAGALAVHAHPFREAHYIDHIRLFPRSVHAVETFNASRSEFENQMAEQYAGNYGLLKFAGSDNHSASDRKMLAGMEFDSPIADEYDFAKKIRAGEGRLFVTDLTKNK
jgi:hypothetical protein